MQFLKNLKHIFAIAVLSLFILFASIFLFSEEFSKSINSFFIYRSGSGVWQDTVYKPWLSPSRSIVLITIDDATLNQIQATSNLKMLTISKSIYKNLIERLYAVWVQGIGFDIIFQNKDPEEQEFLETLKQYPGVVIATDIPENPSCVKDVDSQVETCEWLPRSLYRDIPTGNIFADGYGMIKVVGRIGEPKQIVPPLPTVMYTQTQSGWLPSSYPKERIILNPYFGGPNSYPRISLGNILERGVEKYRWLLEGKYVIIGESGTAIHDSFTSPVSWTVMDGVESHAHFLDGIIQNKMLHMADAGMMFIFYIILALGATLVYFFIPKYISPIFAIIISVFLLWLARYLYGAQRILVDIFPLFLAGSILTYPITYIYKFFVVDREKRELQTNFSHYVDPNVVRQIADKWEEIELWGERRDMTVLFSDIAGFTTISEKLDPTTLFYLMTSYLSNMTDILIQEGGTLDKYIWDAVMGFFGAPITLENHAERACRTALLMRRALPGFNSDIASHGIDPIDFRVGIASGDVLVWNIGSHDRFNYTVLGDTVNLASRLEGTGKEYAVHIIISEGTYREVQDKFIFRELDTIAVKGKSEGVRIYELLGFSGETLDMTHYKKYEEALALYRSGAYLDAGKLWELLIPHDETARIMALRCVEVLKWNIHVENGVYHMTHK
jgi:class 3 adenylate cyclase/CHASE2 domain-containing sensor protein